MWYPIKLFILIFFNSSFFSPGLVEDAPELKFKLLETANHDKTSFTQGLLYENGLIYESSGLYQRSFIQVYDAKTGEPVKHQRLSTEIFAEGMAKINNELFLLTWRRGILFRHDAETLKVTRTMRYTGEGWGLTATKDALVMSNGSDTLSFRDPTNFKELRSLKVTDGNKPVKYLNELEFDGKHLWANQWKSYFIYRIDPTSGKVTAKIDLKSLKPEQEPGQKQDVLNGIAYVPDKKALWVTGKYWSKRYLIRIIP